jgi:hypothetical protein
MRKTESIYVEAFPKTEVLGKPLFAVGSNTPPLGAVRIGNTHNKMVVDPTVK